METKIEVITPEIARNMLTDNVRNRILRRKHVARLATSMRRGEWKLTHQGIAYSSDGELIDGQHRLHAIILAGVPVKMMISFGVDDFIAIDRGASRSVSDLTGMPKKLAEAVKIAGSIIFFQTPEELFEIAESKFGELHEEMIALSPATCRGFSTAPIRAGFVAAILGGGDKDFVFKQYDYLIHQQFSSLSEGASALARQIISGKAKASGRDLSVELLLRAFKASWESRNSSRIQLEPENTKQRVRDILFSTLKGAQHA